MDIKKIEYLAVKHGLGSIYDRPRMVEIDEETIGFKKSGELTPFGTYVIEFANAIERHVTER